MNKLVSSDFLDERLKVAVVSDIDSCITNGSYQRVFSIAEELSKQCNVSLIGTRINRNESMDTYSTRTNSVIKYTFRLANLLQKIKPAVVYAHRNLPGFSVSILRTLGIIPTEVRVVFDFHSSAVFEYMHLFSHSLSNWSSTYRIKKNEFVEKFILSQMCNVITVSTRLKSFLINHYHTDTPLHVVSNGAPESYFKLPKAQRSPYTNTDKSVIALLIAPKGFISNNRAVEMARKISEVLESQQSNVRIVIAGGGWHKELDSNFEVVGFVDNIMDYIDFADICLLPYPNDAVCGGVRTKAVEYLARKKILLTTKEGISGFSGIEHMESVITCSDSISEFAEAIIMVSNDLEKYRYIGENGFRIAEEKYGYSEIAQTILSIFLSETDQ